MNKMNSKIISSSKDHNNGHISYSQPSTPYHSPISTPQVQRHNSLKDQRKEISNSMSQTMEETMEYTKHRRSFGSLPLSEDSPYFESALAFRRNMSTGSVKYLQVPTTPSPKSSPRLVRARQQITRLLTFKMIREGAGDLQSKSPPTQKTAKLANGMQRKTVSFKISPSQDFLTKEDGVDLENQKELYKALVQCIRDEDCKTFRSTTRRKYVDVNTVLENSATLLHEASFKGCVKCIKALIKNGCNVDAVDNQGWTALHASIFSSELAAVKLLLENNASADQLSMGGWSPLHLSVYLNDLYISHELVQNGADPLLCNSQGISPFQLSINLDKSLVLEYFLQLPSFLVKT